jgi:hypothetical protein
MDLELSPIKIAAIVTTIIFILISCAGIPIKRTKTFVTKEANRVIKVDSYIKDDSTIIPQLDTWDTPLNYSIKVDGDLITATVRSYGRDKVFSDDDIVGSAVATNISKKIGNAIGKSFKNLTSGFIEGIKSEKLKVGEKSNE